MKKSKFRKNQLKIPKLIGCLYINCKLKNTLFNLTNNSGQSYKQWSTKSLKKKINMKKNSPYNINLIGYKIRKYLIKKKIKYLKIFLKGRGFGRYNFNKNIVFRTKSKAYRILFYFDKTNIPFNGCRLKKLKRR